MTSIAAPTVRLGLSSFGGYRAEGWHPTLSAELSGPSPAGAEVQWAVSHADGVAWFVHRAPVPELAAGETIAIDLRPAEGGADADVQGAFAFTLRLVSELDGVDELLHEGEARVVALPGEHRFAIDHERMSPPGSVALDTLDEPDAPRLTATVFVPGEAEVWEIEAYLFHDGRRLARADSTTTRHTYTANDGTVVAREFTFPFDVVRGWNSLQASGWGAGWHLLDSHDGHYEVKLVRGGAIVREFAFDVTHGRIVGRDDDYALLTEAIAESVAEPNPAADEGEVEAVVDAVALRAFFDRAERLLLTWEADLLEGQPPFEVAQVLAAEAVLRERPGYETLRDAASALPDGHPVELAGEATTIGGLRIRMQALFTAADARLGGSAQAADDALAPYRALLSGDKLAVFEEHPADAFLYITTDRRVIETPEEIAAAEFWYFEGPLDLPSTATVDGVRVDVTVQGWRVLGWRFGADHSIVDEFETQGHGSSAPKSAYRHVP